MDTIYDESGVPIGTFARGFDRALGLLIVLPLIILSLLITWGGENHAANC